MATGDHAPETLRRYGEAQARLEHAGGYGWRDHATSVCAGWLRRRRPRPGARDLLRRRAHPRLARARARRRSRPAPARRADEPPRHGVPRVARAGARDDRRRRRSSSPTTAGSSKRSRRRCSSSRAGSRPTSPARGTSGGRRRRRAPRRRRSSAERQAEDIARLDRFVARFRYGTKSRQAQSKLKQIARIEAERVEAPKARRRTLGFEFLKPARSGRTVVEAGASTRRGRKPLLEDAVLAIERGEHVALIGPNGSGKSTLLEAIVGRRRLGRIGHGVEPAYFSQHEVELDERGWVLECAKGATGLQRRRRRRSSAASSSPAGTTTRSRWRRSPAASGAASRSRSSSRPARTSSSSTSRRTTSTSRAARRSRPRSRRSPAPSCSSRTTAPCSTRSQSASLAVEDAPALLRRRLGRLRADPRRRERRRRRHRRGSRRRSRSRPKARPQRARADRGVDPGARARARGARAAAGRGLGQRGDARGAHGGARRADRAPRALGAAVRGRAGLTGRGPSLRDDRGVLADPDQERRLALAQEVHADEVEARDDGARARPRGPGSRARRTRRARHPGRVVGPEAAGEDRRRRSRSGRALRRRRRRTAPARGSSGIPRPRSATSFRTSSMSCACRSSPQATLAGEVGRRSGRGGRRRRGSGRAGSRPSRAASGSGGRGRRRGRSPGRWRTSRAAGRGQALDAVVEEAGLDRSHQTMSRPPIRRGAHGARPQARKTSRPASCSSSAIWQPDWPLPTTSTAPAGSSSGLR